MFKQTMGKHLTDSSCWIMAQTMKEYFTAALRQRMPGRKLAAITEFSKGDMKAAMHDVVTKMLDNRELILT